MGDAFDDDEDETSLPGGGSLDLDGGPVSIGQGAAGPSYGGGGVRFDDDFEDELPGGALELDVPQASRRPAPSSPEVPDLALPPPTSGMHQASRASGTMGAVRPSGSMGAVRPSGSMGAVRPSGNHPVAGHSGHMPVATPAAPPPAPSSERSIPPVSPPSSRDLPPESVEAPSGPQPPVSAPKPSAAAIVAGYPMPPNAIWESPVYACRVLWRQLELRQDLASLRKRRSPDVPLYEAALKAHDPKAFTLGLALTCAGLAVASFLFFLPVILRFMRSPD